MMIRTQSIHSADDPLSLALRPPHAESQQQKEDRVRQEAEAKLISDRIDEDLRQQEKEMVKKRKSEIKVRTRNPFTSVCYTPSLPSQIT